MRSLSSSSYLLAVDIGGTFTDIVLLDQKQNELIVGKVLTSHPDPSDAVIRGVDLVLKQHAIESENISRVIHGTTLITNTLIERKGAKTALLTTRGFRDALEIGREGRYDIYDLGLVKPDPLVERRLRLEVPERMDARGEEILPLDKETVTSLCSHLQAEEVEAVAICYLHAYANPDHELESAALFRQQLPGIAIALSHQVAPEMREYQRTSTTVANAYVQPMAQRYMGRLEAGLQQSGVDAPLNIMLSNASTCTVQTASDFPIRLVESGPAGGALAGLHWGRQAGYAEVLAFDMGGTTAKAILTEKGEFSYTTESEVAHVYRFKRGSGLPLMVPMLQMIEIGAGGGSIARTNALGLPSVGPDSAGSAPGPACYGLGGTAPTVTDADLLLGLLNPDHFAQDTMRLDVEAARASFRPLARRLGLAVDRTAWGVHQLVNENMAAAARVHAAERGLDLRRYAMVATGGAGPVHACGVAQRLGIETVVVPPMAGVGSAFGFMLAPVAFDFTRSYLTKLDEVDPAELQSMLQGLEREGRVIVGNAGVAPDAIVVNRSVDMRYVGQGYEIRVPFAAGVLDRAQVGAIRKTFEREYARFYGRLCEEVPIEAVNWRVLVSGPVPDLSDFAAPTAAGSSSIRPTGRAVLFDVENGRVDTSVYKRDQLEPDFRAEGPAIIEEAESTTVVPPGWHAELRKEGVLLLSKG